MSLPLKAQKKPQKVKSKMKHRQASDTVLTPAKDSCPLREGPAGGRALSDISNTASGHVSTDNNARHVSSVPAPTFRGSFHGGSYSPGNKNKHHEEQMPHSVTTSHDFMVTNEGDMHHNSLLDDRSYSQGSLSEDKWTIVPEKCSKAKARASSKSNTESTDSSRGSDPLTSRRKASREVSSKNRKDVAEGNDAALGDTSPADSRTEAKVLQLADMLERALNGKSDPPGKKQKKKKKKRQIISSDRANQAIDVHVTHHRPKGVDKLQQLAPSEEVDNNQVKDFPTCQKDAQSKQGSSEHLEVATPVEDSSQTDKYVTPPAENASETEKHFTAPEDKEKPGDRMLPVQVDEVVSKVTELAPFSKIVGEGRPNGWNSEAQMYKLIGSVIPFSFPEELDGNLLGYLEQPRTLETEQASVNANVAEIIEKLGNQRTKGTVVRMLQENNVPEKFADDSDVAMNTYALESTTTGAVSLMCQKFPNVQKLWPNLGSATSVGFKDTWGAPTPQSENKGRFAAYKLDPQLIVEYCENLLLSEEDAIVRGCYGVEKVFDKTEHARTAEAELSNSPVHQEARLSSEADVCSREIMQPKLVVPSGVDSPLAFHSAEVPRTLKAATDAARTFLDSVFSVQSVGEPITKSVTPIARTQTSRSVRTMCSTVPSQAATSASSPAVAMNQQMHGEQNNLQLRHSFTHACGTDYNLRSTADDMYPCSSADSVVNPTASPTDLGFGDVKDYFPVSQPTSSEPRDLGVAHLDGYSRVSLPRDDKPVETYNFPAVSERVRSPPNPPLITSSPRVKMATSTNRAHYKHISGLRTRDTDPSIPCYYWYAKGGTFYPPLQDPGCLTMNKYYRRNNPYTACIEPEEICLNGIPVDPMLVFNSLLRFSNPRESAWNTALYFGYRGHMAHVVMRWWYDAWTICEQVNEACDSKGEVQVDYPNREVQYVYTHSASRSRKASYFTRVFEHGIPFGYAMQQVDFNLLCKVNYASRASSPCENTWIPNVISKYIFKVIRQCNFPSENKSLIKR